MSHNKIKSQLIFEFQQIDDLFTSYKDLLDKCKNQEPNLVELKAIGSILYSLRWNELKKLTHPVLTVWLECKKELEDFLDNIDGAIMEAEAEYLSGTIMVDARETLSSLKSKYFK